MALPADQDVLMGRGTHNIPASDKRCSRQSLKVRFDSKSAQVQVTQMGVNPGIVNHGTPQEAYMVVNQTYNLDNGQKFTVLMHDYEFTVSIPGSNASAPKAAAAPVPVALISKKEDAFDWMAEDVPVKATENVSASNPHLAPSPAPVSDKPLCMYGVNCRRNNPVHFQEYSHPHLEIGATPAAAPSPASGSKPLCSYGINCRRNNPVHFQQYAHPHLEGKSESPIPTSTPPSTTALPAAAPSPHVPSAVNHATNVTTSEEAALAKFESNLNVNLHPSVTVSKPPITSEASPTPTSISSAKRPMPAVDLMDDEENYLPQPKKAKVVASSSTINKGNLMDWMGEEAEPATVAKTATSEATNPQLSAIPTASPSSSQAPPPSQQSNKSNASMDSVPSSETKLEYARKEEDLKKRPVSAATGSHSMEVDNPKLLALRACKLGSIEELDDLVGKMPWKPLGSLALIVPCLGRGYSVQEAVDTFLETLGHFVKKAKVGNSLKVIYWPETPAWAAAMRRRLSAISMTPTEVEEVNMAEIVEMMAPSTPVETALKACTQDRVIIGNDSNWRFKGIGTPNSFNVHLNKVYGTPFNPSLTSPNLLNDTKTVHSVGSECTAYPVAISPNSGIKKADLAPNATHIIQLVPPTAADPNPDIKLLKTLYISLFGCLLHLASVQSSS